MSCVIKFRIVEGAGEKRDRIVTPGAKPRRMNIAVALQQELASTEDRIQRSRRFYNANVRDMNTRVESFPSNIIAALFSFKQEEFFEIADAAVREVPSARF